MGAVIGLNELGIRIPEELSVTGYNNSAVALYCEPELTSVDNGVRQLCGNAVENLVKILQGQQGIGQDNRFACEIVKRCTTDF